jgi:hypothetical protein
MIELTKEPVSLICTRDCTLWGFGSALTLDKGHVIVANIDCLDNVVIEYGPFNLFELPSDNFHSEWFEVCE